MFLKVIIIVSFRLSHHYHVGIFLAFFLYMFVYVVEIILSIDCLFVLTVFMNVFPCYLKSSQTKFLVSEYLPYLTMPDI